jgi:hypothetical protein
MSLATSNAGRGVARDVEGHLEPEHVVAAEAPVHERPELGACGPLPRPRLDVAVREDEPAGHGLQRIDRGLRMVGGLQAV